MRTMAGVGVHTSAACTADCCANCTSIESLLRGPTSGASREMQRDGPCL